MPLGGYKSTALSHSGDAAVFTHLHDCNGLVPYTHTLLSVYTMVGQICTITTRSDADPSTQLWRAEGKPQ